jgi:hypothetical protein
MYLKTKSYHLAVLLCSMAIVLAQTGCVKDNCTGTRKYAYFVPVYKTKQEVRNNIKSANPQPIVQAGKLSLYGNYIFLNELNKGIHVIDNSNPANPRNLSFIPIPGNVDIAIRNNLLYADLYSELVVIDISTPQQVRLKEIAMGIFPERFYGGFSADSSRFITDWVPKEVELPYDCESDPNVYWGFQGGVGINTIGQLSNGAPAVAPIGINGSLARFAIVNEHLYTVSHSSLKVIRLNTGTPLTVSNEKQLGWGIETIYPFRDKLFIGSNRGMFIYDLQNPNNPQQLSTFTHATACDPVIADNDYAYVTLRSGVACSGANNQLDVINVSNLQSPQLVRTYPLTNPIGLSKSGDLLFVCDGVSGVRVFNASDPAQLLERTRLNVPEPYEVIAWNTIALVVAKDGLYQYDYSNPSSIRLLSKMGVAQ